jgi:hypothetical protein
MAGNKQLSCRSLPHRDRRLFRKTLGVGAIERTFTTLALELYHTRIPESTSSLAVRYLHLILEAAGTGPGNAAREECHGMAMRLPCGKGCHL